MRYFLSREAAVITLMSLVIMFLSMMPMALQISRIPAGHEFIPVHNSLSDYPFYTSIIAQGIDGDLTVKNKFTSEIHNGSFIQYIYLLIGRAGSIVSIFDIHILYHISRYTLGAILIILMYALAKAVISDSNTRVIAVFFMLFSGSFPRIFAEKGAARFGTYMTWWSELDPIVRVAFLPHYLAGKIFLIISILILISLYKSQKHVLVKIVALSISVWICGYLHPPVFFLFFLTATIWSLFLVRKIRVITPLFTALAIGATSIIFIKTIYSQFPWYLSRAYEALSFALTVKEYVLALGISVPLSVIGLISYRKNQVLWFMAIWVISDLILLDRVRLMPFSEYEFIRNLSISNIRFLQVGLWIPLGILSAYGVRFIKSKTPGIIYGIFMLTVILMTFITYPESVRYFGGINYGGYGFMYPKKEWIEAIKAIKTLTQKDDVILALPLAGQIIPAYTNRTAYVGTQVYHTKDLDIKMRNAWQFYHGDLSNCEAYKLLKDNRISLVFYGWDERGQGTAVSYYAFLLPWQKYGDTVLYRFTDVKPEGCGS